MANSKKKKTQAEKDKQRIRTRMNKVRKINKAMLTANDPQKKNLEKALDKYKSK